MRNFFVAMTRDPISLVGAAITTASALLIITLLVLEVVGFHGNPYIGILAYLIVPGLFLLGLLLIPVGVLRQRHRMRRAADRGEKAPVLPVLDLNSERIRKTILVFVVLTMANVIILATATYKGVEVMDSTAFCGTTCHTVMLPEYTAYNRSPHARVKCVECHIGPGADWFVKSKLSGAWQVVAVTFDLYPRPIPTPIENLRPARETCEQCHWPTKFVGDRLKIITRYAEDEANTETKTVLLLRVGGIQGRKSHGIHWHVDPNIQVRYRSDPTREIIQDVELTLPDGTVKLFANNGAANAEADAQGGETSEWRVMDCVDCHNRPTHVYRQPEEELDLAILENRIDRSLPYVRREGHRALREDYASGAAAREAIAATLRGFYSENYPELVTTKASEIDDAAEELGRIWSTNVFPTMKVTWGTYPNHVGHQNFPGCFRCHNDEHATEGGEVISQDCFTCHSVLAIEEENPEIVEMLKP